MKRTALLGAFAADLFLATFSLSPGL